MISINQDRDLTSGKYKTAAEKCARVYQILVATRKGIPYWSIPRNMCQFVSKLVDYVEKTDYEVWLYLEAQFYFFDASFCKRTYNLVYPPLNSIINEKSLMRCERYSVYISSLRKRGLDTDARDKKIMLEYTRFKSSCIDSKANLNKNILESLVISGTISLHCLALVSYLMPTYKKEMYDAYEFLKYMEGYTMNNRIWEECNKYIKRKEKDEWLKS